MFILCVLCLQLFNNCPINYLTLCITIHVVICIVTCIVHPQLWSAPTTTQRMAELAIEDPLDIQCVTDAARDQLSNILNEVQGAKDVVIQAELMSLLNHVTPFSFLKK